MSTEELYVSVVMPTHGRRQSLLQVLRALSRQTVSARKFEVIVICDGDVDGSAAACRSLSGELPFVLRVLEQDNMGPAAARNRGLWDARGDLVLFLDDDVVPDDRLIESHLACQQGQEQRVTIGPLLPPPDFHLNLWGAWEERTLCSQYQDMVAGRWAPTFRQFYTGNASVLRRHLVQLGGFDPSFRRAEDVELALRMARQGLHFTFVPGARGWHHVRRSFASWIQMPVAYGQADVAMSRTLDPGVMKRMAREYRGRHPAVRALVRGCAGRPTTCRLAVRVLGGCVRALDRTGPSSLGQGACSLLFNLCYYDGVAGAMGGRRALVQILQSHKASTMPEMGPGSESAKVS